MARPPERSSGQATDFNLTTSISAIGGVRALFAASEGPTGSGASGAIYVTDGTAAGTSRVIGLQAPRNFAPLGNGLIVFENTDAAHGNEVWVTDGTAAGTRLLADTVPGTVGKNIITTASGFGILRDGRAAFLVVTPEQGNSNSFDTQLWTTDGTTAGTTVVKDFGPAPGYSYTAVANGFQTLADGRVVFFATTTVLWVSDGTASGTVPLVAGSGSLPLGGLSGAQLVDAPFYYGLYGDVAAAGVNSAQHYDASGWHDSRDPDAFFSTAGYLRAAGVNPLQHFLANGITEGRSGFGDRI